MFLTYKTVLTIKLNKILKKYYIFYFNFSSDTVVFQNYLKFEVLLVLIYMEKFMKYFW